MRRFIELNSVDSTNNFLHANFRELPLPVFVRAEEQTAGRGRLERSWFSGAAGENLIMSALVRIPPQAIAVTGVIAGMALYRALPQIPGLCIKWPNDIRIGERKLAGILCERIEHSDLVIIGIGVNVHSVEFPQSVANIATSLRSATGEQYDIRRLWVSVCRSLMRHLSQFSAPLSAEFLSDFRRVAWRYLVRPELGDSPVEFQNLLPDGRAQVMSGTGVVVLDIAD